MKLARKIVGEGGFARLVDFARKVSDLHVKYWGEMKETVNQRGINDGKKDELITRGTFPHIKAVSITLIVIGGIIGVYGALPNLPARQYGSLGIMFGIWCIAFVIEILRLKIIIQKCHSF
jgi:hypothetical protein